MIDIKQWCEIEIFFYWKFLNYFHLFEGNIDNLISQINRDQFDRLYDSAVKKKPV